MNWKKPTEEEGIGRKKVRQLFWLTSCCVTRWEGRRWKYRKNEQQKVCLFKLICWFHDARQQILAWFSCCHAFSVPTTSWLRMRGEAGQKALNFHSFLCCRWHLIRTCRQISAQNFLSTGRWSALKADAKIPKRRFQRDKRRLIATKQVENFITFHCIELRGFSKRWARVQLRQRTKKRSRGTSKAPNNCRSLTYFHWKFNQPPLSLSSLTRLSPGRSSNNRILQKAKGSARRICASRCRRKKLGSIEMHASRAFSDCLTLNSAASIAFAWFSMRIFSLHLHPLSSVLRRETVKIASFSLSSFDRGEYSNCKFCYLRVSEKGNFLSFQRCCSEHLREKSYAMFTLCVT